MAKKTTKAAINKTGFNLAFFSVLERFYQSNKGSIKRNYKQITKDFLSYNDAGDGPENSVFLRRPQFEALEMYIFLKEFTHNAYVHDLFKAWYKKEDIFENDRTMLSHQDGSFMDQLELTDEIAYQANFEKIQQAAKLYPNYVFALTMGLGKTILMATCIYYDFLLANKFGKDKRFCHNVLVFAPDTTVLHALKEIQSFDLTKVVPPEYASWLAANIKFHFLDSTDASLSTIEGSKFNVVISNAQKIILKKKNKKNPSANMFFNAGATEANETLKKQLAMLGQDIPQEDVDLSINARFQKIIRLGQLGIFVDEAHHAMGKDLAESMGLTKKESSLRYTIDQIANALEKKGSHVVACYNFTGTPYIGQNIMPEVVYHYGLKDSIEKGYLKDINIQEYEGDVKSEDFIRLVVSDFWNKEGETRRENLLPKLAFFASTVKELQNELRPALEKALNALDIPLDRILVNVGDPKLTTNDDIREFNRLDTPLSEKQFILLVGKGKEGWNCRSLFGVALHRKPKSTIFVLQATMRCLRQIGEQQETGRVYLSHENLTILENELNQNFRVSTSDLKRDPIDKTEYQVSALPPPRTYKLKKKKKLTKVDKKEPTDNISFNLTQDKIDQYQRTLREHVHYGQDAQTSSSKINIHDALTQKKYSSYMLVSEIARYFNPDEISAFMILETLNNAQDIKLDALCALVNQTNDLLYAEIIPTIFKYFYETSTFDQEIIEFVELVKGYNDDSAGPPGPMTFRAHEHLVVSHDLDGLSHLIPLREKSFHLDHYCFDSNSEREFFDHWLKDDNVKKIYFTGMLTQGQSAFRVQYIDPDSHRLRSYYPDFLIETKEGRLIFVEVKAANQVDDSIVQAKKQAATELADNNGAYYILVKHNEVKTFNIFDSNPSQARLFDA